MNRIIAGLIAAATLTIAITGCGGPSSPTPAKSSSTTQAVPAVRPSNNVSPTCTTPRFTITAPKQGAKAADGSKGVTFEGEACLPKDQTIWAFDSTDSGVLNLDYPTEGRATVPITIESGVWSFRNSPIGDAGMQNQLNVVTFIAADSNCEGTIRNTSPDANGDIVITTPLPKGCKVVTTWNLYVTNK